MVVPFSWSGPLPELLPSPFDELGPSAVARAAAEALMRELAPLDEGKMFGVLVVRGRGGELGYLKAFSGLLGGRWDVPGFAPPVFDRAEREAVEPEGDACVKRLSARSVPDASADKRALAELLGRHAASLSALRALHEERRRARRAVRDATTAPDQLHALDQQSRGDKAERRRREAELEAEASELQRRVARMERRALAKERLGAMVSRRLMQRIHDAYLLPSARGETRPMRALFSPGEPPSGAGDCAAPKLLAAASALGLSPVALAEFWWGPPPRGGGRTQGAYYPACRNKCAPLLPFMLEGLRVAPPRLFAPPLSKTELQVVYEDASLVVIEKPEGVLSIPAKDEAYSDSVLARLRARFPAATGPMIVHRLDLDTSGLLVAALSAEAYSKLQRQFVEREVRKEYVAVLAGEVRGEAGVVELPLRVDLEDRPRQIVDLVHGKRAVTQWRVLSRSAGRTRVSLAPITGRTHQLRVHAAHPLGLGAPIVGDRLYGHPAERLLLHAESLSFRHPVSAEELRFRRAAPF